MRKSRWGVVSTAGAVVFAVTSFTRVTPAAAQAVFGSASTSSQPQNGRPADPHRQAEPERQSDRRQAEPQRQADRPQADGRGARPPQHADHGNARTPGPKSADHWPDNGRNSSVFIRSSSNDSKDIPSLTPRPGEDVFRATPGTYAPRGPASRGPAGRRDRGRSNGSLYLGYPYLTPFGYAPYYPSALSETAETPGIVSGTRRSRQEAEGFLRLRVQPRSADVFVDGAFAGIVDDFGGAGERLLPAGTHRVEIAAPGFERVTFDVRVPANDTIIFTRDLDRLDDRPQPPAAPPVEIPHKTMYIVPHCYAGDTPPRATDLRPGCRIADLRTIP